LRGVDPGRGVAVNALWDDFSVRDGSARLWPQTEWLKAALWLAPGDPAEALRAIGGLEKYFATPVAGLWRDKLDANGAFVEEFAPASSFYHIVCALDALWGALGEGAAAF
jgi:mannose-6-phosphate isomerase